MQLCDLLEWRSWYGPSGQMDHKLVMKEMLKSKYLEILSLVEWPVTRLGPRL